MLSDFMKEGRSVACLENFSGVQLYQVSIDKVVLIKVTGAFFISIPGVYFSGTRIWPTCVFLLTVLSMNTKYLKSFF